MTHIKIKMGLINSIQKNLFRVSYKHTTFEQRGFFVVNKNHSKHLEAIGKSFLDGYHLALKGYPYNELITQLNEYNAFFRGFSFEGAAMGSTLLNFFSLKHESALKGLLEKPESNKHIYMLHVGVGWAFARLPVNIERRIQKFHPVLRWLIIDGYGFHQAYFKTNKYVYRMQQPKEFMNPFSLKVFYQGVGRCLWFIDCATPEKIADRISKFPKEYHEDLWSGVGLACTYAGEVKEPEIQRLKEFSGSFIQHLAQGSAFAAKARYRAEIITPYNELACQLICNLSIKEAASITDYCLLQVPEELIAEKQYSMWRKLIRNSIYDENGNITKKVSN